MMNACRAPERRTILCSCNPTTQVENPCQADDITWTREAPPARLPARMDTPMSRLASSLRGGKARHQARGDHQGLQRARYRSGRRLCNRALAPRRCLYGSRSPRRSNHPGKSGSRRSHQPYFSHWFNLQELPRNGQQRISVRGCEGKTGRMGSVEE